MRRNAHSQALDLEHRLWVVQALDLEQARRRIVVTEDLAVGGADRLQVCPVGGDVRDEVCELDRPLWRASGCSERRAYVADGLGELSRDRSEEHTSELQSLTNLVCRLLLEKKKQDSTAACVSCTPIA